MKLSPWLLPKLLVVASAFRLLGAENAVIRNADFEEGSATLGWELAEYGAKPEVAVDRQEKQHERQALRISATEPSDTALGQEIALKPRCWYQFTGWVRTEGLDPKGSPTFGTLQVQSPQGSGIIASGNSHQGNTPWTEVRVYFCAPADGRVRLCLFFVGFGRGTGTAWFDNLGLSEIKIGDYPITITPEHLNPARISRLQYGQFVEYLCDLVPSMWAEKLADGSFEGLSPYKFVFLKETDFKAKPWYPSGAVNRADFTRDKADKISGEFSQRIAVPDGAPCSVGISQDGIAVERGQGCDFSVWLRTSGVTGAVEVTLHHEAAVLASAVLTPSSEWKRQTVRLVPSVTDAQATLSVSFHAPGTLWLDNASLMPTRNLGGWRPEVVAAVRALRPGVIRFGGSTLDDPNLGEFEWKGTIGDPDHRQPFRAWGGLQPTGPGLEEFVQFCRLVDSEPLICVRFSRKTPRDAAEEVEYFNGPASSPMGAWRARNGHPEPYRLRFWQVGNERESPDYENQLADFCAAMRRVDPNIKIFSSFPTAGVLDKAGAWLDFVCPHHYSHDLVAMDNDLDAVSRLILDHGGGRDIKIAVTEWNTTAGDAGPRRAMLWTLENALACSRYHNLLHRHSHQVVVANRSNLANSFCSGIIQMDNHRLYKTPTYYAQQLYSTYAGDWPLRIASDIPVQVGLDLSATLSEDGKTMTLFAVNDSLDEITRVIDLGQIATGKPALRVWTLTDRHHSGEPDVTNSFGEPERLVPTESSLKTASTRFPYHFPALSLTVLRCPATAVGTNDK